MRGTAVARDVVRGDGNACDVSCRSDGGGAVIRNGEVRGGGDVDNQRSFVGEHENENSERQRTEQRVESIKDFLDVIPSRDGRRCNQQEPLGSAASLCEEHKTTLCPQADEDEWSEISRNGQELKEKLYIHG